MTQRFDFMRAAPDAFKAMVALSTYVNDCGLEASLLHLVKLRASQINGCANCINMHFQEALADGDAAERLVLLDAWRETDAYSPREQAALADAFLKASRSGDMAGLMAVLAPDARLTADGGGKRPAALKPILGAERIAAFFARFIRAGMETSPLKATPLQINGLPGYVTIERDGLPQTTAFEIENGRITAVYVVRNPDKLGRLMNA